MKGQGQGVVKIELSRTDSTYPNPKPRGNLAYISLVAIKSFGEMGKMLRAILAKEKGYGARVVRNSSSSVPRGGCYKLLH